jgi:hypothetical protein
MPGADYFGQHPLAGQARTIRPASPGDAVLCSLQQGMQVEHVPLASEMAAVSHLQSRLEKGLKKKGKDAS